MSNPKITQIAAASGEPVIGLGEDGMVYMWNPTPVAHWELYGNEPPPRCGMPISMLGVYCHNSKPCLVHDATSDKPA